MEKWPSSGLPKTDKIETRILKSTLVRADDNKEQMELK